MAFSFEDLAPWLALAGTGGNIYNLYSQNRAQAQARRDWERAQAEQRAAYQQEQDQINQYYRQFGDYMSTANDRWAAYLDAVRQPLDPSPYFRQLTDVEQAAVLRTPKANLAERGIQPGGYWDSISAEVLAKDAENRWATALGAAEAQRQGVVGAGAGVGPAPTSPVFGPAGVPGVPYPNYSSPNLGGAIDPFAQFLRWQQLMRVMGNRKDTQPGQTYNPPDTLSGVPARADKPEDPSNYPSPYPDLFGP